MESTQPTDNSDGTDISPSFLQAQLELSVAQGVVNTCHGGPKLASLQKPWGGESRLLSRIRMFPLTGADLQLRVRSILQRVFLCCPLTRFDLGDLLKWSNRFKNCFRWCKPRWCMPYMHLGHKLSSHSARMQETHRMLTT